MTGNGNVLLGGSGADRLVVTSGSGDKLVAGSGTDTLADGGTQGFYDFGRGDAQTAIVNGAAGAVAPSNELDFGANITDQNLWFLQSGNNLQIDLMGTSSAVTVDGWFSGAGHQLDEITAGGLRIDSQVTQLVQAMATFQADNPSFGPTATTQDLPTRYYRALSLPPGTIRLRLGRRSKTGRGSDCDAFTAALRTPHLANAAPPGRPHSAPMSAD